MKSRLVQIPGVQVCSRLPTGEPGGGCKALSQSQFPGLADRGWLRSPFGRDGPPKVAHSTASEA